ncbi:MAG TPA: PIN domain-containing protein [Candidatus Nanoarchaeia archaeon]|nr:PIN domain-containing protein [Candidatus Nanoarchaeia archaeon]
MAKVVLDTNFILNCVANKLDFFDEILMKGHIIQIPLQVIEEIKRLKNSSKAVRFREQANLALKLIEVNDFEKIDVPGRYVDVGLRKYLGENPKIILGTMDKELKKSVKNRKMVVRNKKKLELQ